MSKRAYDQKIALTVSMMREGRMPAISVMNTIDECFHDNFEEFKQETSLFLEEPLNKKKDRQLNRIAREQVADITVKKYRQKQMAPASFYQNLAFVITEDKNTFGMNVQLMDKNEAIEKYDEIVESRLSQKIQGLVKHYKCA